MKKLIDVTEADGDKLIWVKDKNSRKWISGILLEIRDSWVEVLVRMLDCPGFKKDRFLMAKSNPIFDRHKTIKNKLRLLDEYLMAEPDEIIEM